LHLRRRQSVEGEVAHLIEDEEFRAAEGLQAVTEPVFLRIALHHVKQIRDRQEAVGRG